MQRIDRLTTERYGVRSLSLMENAGAGVVAFLHNWFDPLSRHSIVIVCGKGNNGGDGLVAARLLITQGLAPRVLLLALPESLKGDARTNYEALAAMKAPEVVPDFDAWEAVKPTLADATLIVDAILGTGLSKPVDGFFLEVIRDLNSLKTAKKISIDLPSGIAADTGEIIGESILADATVTFTAPKISHVFPPACERAGRWRVEQIGTPPEALDSDPDLFLSLTCRNELAWLTVPRKMDTHKGTYGHVLIVAGSRGKTGAAALAARSALRSGAGLVTIATPASSLPVISALGVEFMTEPLPETADGTIAAGVGTIERLRLLVEGKTVLAIGPGLGNNAQTQEAIRTIVNYFHLPMVIDADALNAFAGKIDQMETEARVRVLTPHPGEMSRLVNLATPEIQRRRVEVARDFATKHNLHLVLKGARTLVASPGGQVAVNPTGSPAMATAGAGDCLTGIVAGLLAQYSARNVAEVVSAAVYVHGLAGDLAAADLGEASVIAGDIVEAIPRALLSLKK